MSALTNTDHKQLEALNITAEQVERQINQFKTGFPFRFHKLQLLQHFQRYNNAK